MRPHARRRGQSLLELVAAVTLIAAALVPALRMMRDALEQSRRVETQELLSTLCVSKLEEHLALVFANWSATTVAGDFAADGYAQVRFRVVRSDDALQGGIADRLMAVTATVWEDQDGDTVLDVGEPSTVLASKAAKIEGYLE